MFFSLLGQDFVKFIAQIIQEKRVYHLVDILYRGVVHASAAPGHGIQRAFENGPEDGGRNLAPVEVEARVLQQRLLQLLRENRNLNLLLEQAAVGVRKRLQVVFQVFAAFLQRRVEHTEELLQGLVQVFGTASIQEVVELVMPEHGGILGVHAENEAHTQDVEPAQGLGRIVVVSL